MNYSWFSREQTRGGVLFTTSCCALATSLIWLFGALQQGVDWFYLEITLDVRSLVIYTSQTFGEVFVFVAAPLTLAARFSKSVALVFLVAAAITVVFVAWHLHLQDWRAALALGVGEIIICFAFLRVSEWGVRPFAGLVAGGAIHWIGNAAMVTAAYTIN